MAAHGKRIGIAGAGVLGRLLAWQLGRAGHAVTVFDAAAGQQPPAVGTCAVPGGGLHAAGFTAAGMLSPMAELESAGPQLAQRGWRSLARWRQIADALRSQGWDTPLFAQHGSLLLAHGSDQGVARRVLARLQPPSGRAADLPAPQALTPTTLAVLEPALAPGLHGWLLPGEGQVFPREMLTALALLAPQVQWCWGQRVVQVAPGRIDTADGAHHAFDWAIDVRGLGAQGALPLRGVRGELVWLHAPAVQLQRPLRLLHPRHRVYIVPRPGQLFVVGASEIESEDRSPVSLRSAVELMSAAHSAVPALAEARLVHLETNLRPALPDNEARIHQRDGLLSINGLFRHGWLLAPALVQDALAQTGLLTSHPTATAPAEPLAPSPLPCHAESVPHPV